MPILQIFLSSSTRSLFFFILFEICLNIIGFTPNYINIDKMAELKDPLNNRTVKNCPVPFQKSLTEENIFTGKTVNWPLLRDFLKREGKLTKPLLLNLVKKAQSIFSRTFIIQRSNLTWSPSKILSLLLATSMDNIMISSNYWNQKQEDSPAKPLIYSWVIMWIGAIFPYKLCAWFSPSKYHTQKQFLCWEEITSAGSWPPFSISESSVWKSTDVGI